MKTVIINRVFSQMRFGASCKATVCITANFVLYFVNGKQSSYLFLLNSGTLCLLRYQCTPKLTILPNFSYWYSQVHLIEFFQLQKVLRKKVSLRQSYNGKTILWMKYLYLEAVNKLSWSIKVSVKSRKEAKASDCLKMLTEKPFDC